MVRGTSQDNKASEASEVTMPTLCVDCPLPGAEDCSHCASRLCSVCAGVETCDTCKAITCLACVGGICSRCTKIVCDNCLSQPAGKLRKCDVLRCQHYFCVDCRKECLVVHKISNKYQLTICTKCIE